MTNILVHMSNPSAVLEVLRRTHPDLRPAVSTSYDALAADIAARAPEVIFSDRFQPGPFPGDAMIRAPSVRWISVAGSGTNHFPRWDPARLTVTNTAGVAAEAMAQFALGALLHFALDVPGLLADQAGRVWRTRSIAPLSGKTVALVGLGQTGQAAARLFRGVGMRVIGVRARPRPMDDLDAVYGTDDLATALSQADAVLVCLPLTDQTTGLIGAAALSALRPGAILVDLSRGGIVDHGALMSALDNGPLAGAALDVFPTEPLPQDNPLWARQDVLISPHCSGIYEGWEQRAAEMFAENLGRWQAGTPLANVVDPVRGY